MRKKIPTVGDLLRHDRLSNGLTQAELAERIGLRQPSSIAQWENGYPSIVMPDPNLIHQGRHQVRNGRR